MANDLGKTLWRCRRGARELDALLHPYVNAYYEGFSPAQRATLDQLLACPDPDLLDWFLNRAQPNSPSLAALVGEISQFNKRGR